MRTRPRGPLVRLVLAALAAIAATLAVAAPASAAAPETGWTCRAQSLTLTAGGQTPLQELTNILASGGDFQPCAPTGNSPVASALKPLTDALAVLGVGVSAVETGTTSEVSKPTRDQVPTARAKVATLNVALAGTQLVHADAVESTTTGRCVNGKATLASTFDVGNLTVFGQAVDLDQPVTQISRGILGLQVLVRVTPGAVTESAAFGHTRRALRVEVLTGIGPLQVSVLDLGVGVSNVSVKGDPCAAAAAPTVGVPTADGRTLTATVAPPAGGTLSGCSFTVTPATGPATTIPGVIAGGTCTAVLPPSAYPAGVYTATATATTAAGGAATSTPSAPFTLTAPTAAAPTVLAPSIEGRTVAASATPATGTTIASCRFLLTPAGGSTVAVAGTFADGRCSATLPRASFPPGGYTVVVTATASNAQVGEATGPATIAGPTVGTPIAVGPLVGAPVTPGAGATIASCSLAVTPAGGGPTQTVAGTYDAPTGGCAAILPAATFPAGDYDVTVTATDSNGDAAVAGARVTVGQFAFGTTPSATPKAPSTSDVAQALLVCEGGKVTLTDVSRSGSRVRVTGVAQAGLKGQTAAIRFVAKGRSATTVARVKVGADGTFSVAVKAPAARYRTSKANGRYSASIAGSTSRAFKLVRRTVFTRTTVGRGTIRVSGRVAAPLPRKGTAVKVTRRLTCSRYTTVVTARTDAKGRFSASFKAPADGAAGVYRAGTKVPSRKGGPARSSSFTLFRIVAGK
ncbi:hypothetical protein [Patulibacter sp.]|uniref:hypothetical protein n=1 Tax=Patulibacter sp. TaxID=1912859 RepID=UPI0027192BE6|nr:hypothetical protein [Patulibacter sp.]MDO9409909.1 hypothetical protein [Patulibacter sp.]